MGRPCQLLLADANFQRWGLSGLRHVSSRGRRPQGPLSLGWTRGLLVQALSNVAGLVNVQPVPRAARARTSPSARCVSVAVLNMAVCKLLGCDDLSNISSI